MNFKAFITHILSFLKKSLFIKTFFCVVNIVSQFKDITLNVFLFKCIFVKKKKYVHLN